MSRLFCFGLGYSGRVLARRLAARGWTVAGTSRSPVNIRGLAEEGFTIFPFDGLAPLSPPAFTSATHILISVPPGEVGDPVLKWHATDLGAHAQSIDWLGYLSTTGVYGDRRGGWVDETSTLDPDTDRGRRRVEAEASWLALHRRAGLPVHIFRLAGIYGPERSQLDSVRDGTARSIVKPGQVFSRIHVDDVAGVLEASIARPRPGGVYNVCDDEPAPPQDVVAYAAKLLGLAPPPEISLSEADLSPMARSFYADCKRVRNDRVKNELSYRLLYPTYREGLKSLLDRL